MKHLYKRALATLCAIVMMLGAVPFTASAATTKTVLFYEGFEGSAELPAGWTAYDVDGDGYNWEINSYGYSGYPDSGNCLESRSANSSISYMKPNEYITLPPVEIPSSIEYSYELSFWVRTSYMTGYADYITVYASTTPIVDPTTLTKNQIVVDKKYYSGNAYQEVTADLSDYRGETLYLAFHHHTASGVWQQFIDDVTVFSYGATRYPVKFDVDEDIVTILPQSGTYEVIDGQDYAFSVKIGDGHKAGNGTIEVVANGEVIKPAGSTYVLKSVRKKQEVSVTFRYRAGDISGNGKVDLADAARLFYYVNEQIDFDSVQLAASDIDTYATVDLRDMTALYHYVAGIRDYVNEKTDIEGLWNELYVDETNGFDQTSSVETADYYLDRRLVLDHTAAVGDRDGKVIFKNEDSSRVVNLSDGYVFTMPYVNFETDYSLSAYRSTYKNSNFVLNVSKETSNPYGNTQSSWDTYSYEWLLQCVQDGVFLSRNDLTRTYAVENDTTMLSGFHVWRYDIVINDAENIEMPYYSIAVIRKKNVYNKFYLMVMKSTGNRSAAMDTMVKSFKETSAVGVSQNEQIAYTCEIDENWNEETTAYYEKLLMQSTTDWGIFTESLSDTNNSADNLREEYAELSSKLDFTYDIMPTYSHIGWGSTMHYFPIKAVTEFAGGNGFNGKPVLQFTYQFTTNNNGNVKGSATPMFDIARGEYDEHFRRLARDIKAYGKPVLFRLNNEMNTDWTSYCGMVTLLDPDFFTLTWERLYDIFEQEGVDNCIWIFNPVATTTPYCSWGEDLCYLPDLDTVHMLGLTAYEMGNGRTLQSFEKLYRDLYEKNSPYFNNYPQIISEFAAGAGGEKQFNYSSQSYENTVLGRNASLQAQWVKDMFECLAKRNEEGYEFCQAIKAAVWFSVNDYATIDNTNYIINYLEIHDASIEAFKNGLALHP